MSERHLVLDTGILISHLRDIPGVKQLLLKLTQQFTFSISTVTVAEIWQGAKPGEVEDTKIFLQGFDIIPLSSGLAEKSGKLAAELKSKGFTIDFADTIIAATAIEYDAPVLTTNTRHFKIIPDLEVWDLKQLLEEME